MALCDQGAGTLTDVNNPARLAGFVPIRIYPKNGALAVDWCHLGTRRFSEPFFRGTVETALLEPFNQAFRPETPIEALEDFARESPGIAPTAFVFHASRCGSTLLARMLATLRSHVVVSEPTMLEAILHPTGHVPPMTRERRIALLRALFSALGQPRCGEETRFVVKLDAWNIVALPIIREAFPDVPWLYLYRDPAEIAVSQWRAPGAHVVPGILGPAAALVPPDAARAMPREEFIARVVGRLLEAGALHCAADGGLPVHYEEVTSALQPPLASTLGVDRAMVDRDALAAVLAEDAKTPQLPFAPDSEQKRNAISPALRDAVLRHADAPYRALEALRAGRSHVMRSAAPGMPDAPRWPS
jgi:hypothetical protein